MIQAFITGKVCGQCQSLRSKTGSNYIRFRVAAEEKGYGGRIVKTFFRCYCFNMEFAGLKEGDDVVVTGSLEVVEKDGQIKGFDVFVRNMSTVSREDE